MPSSVAALFDAAGLAGDGVVCWRTPVPETATGVYIVALTKSRRSRTCALADAPLAAAHLKHLLKVRPEVRLDGRRPSATQLAARLGAFWLPDEVVLYIGLAGQPLRTRVSQYYTTTLGAKRPHAGGWPLKTLSVLDELWVHYAATPDYADAEGAMLRAFAAAVSPASRASLHDPERVAPFANLRTGTGLVKRHGITGATGDLKGATPGSQQSSPRRARKPPATTRRHLQPVPSATAGGELSQRVTARDLAAGQVRLPRAAKRLFPAERGHVVVVVRGRELSARWDPRVRPDRERSGVLAFGRGELAGLVEVDDVLAARARSDGRPTLE